MKIAISIIGAGILVWLGIWGFSTFGIVESDINVINGTSTTTKDTSPIGEVGNVFPYGRVSLKIGESAQFKNNKITLASVFDDSRCPTDVTCIWEGTIKADIRAVADGEVISGTLEQGTFIDVRSERITLVEVSPLPQSDKEISPADYLLTFEVIAIK